MGRAFLHGQSSGGNEGLNLIYSPSGNLPSSQMESWFTRDTTFFVINKTTWTKMYYLKSDQYKKAFAHLNIRQSGAYADIALSKIGEPVPAYFTSYVIYEVKLDIGPDGRIGVYAKLSQDYSNDTYTIKDGTSVGNIYSAFMAPIA